MSKVSEELSKRTNELSVGLYGGRGPKDLVTPLTNVRPRPADADQDGIKDQGVSQELSESRDFLKVK